MEQNKETKTRILSIDRFRGLCMFIMVLSFLLGVFEQTFEKLTPLFEHGDSGFQIINGVAFADIFAPMFIFVIGLTYVQSFKSREAKYGTKVAYFQIALRYLGLMGIGALLNGLEDGWLDVFDGDKYVGVDFKGMDLNMKVFAIGFIIAIALVVLVVISRFFKNEKFKTVASNMLRYFLALMGVFVLYFMVVSTGEKVGQKFGGDFTNEMFGGWIWDTLQNIGFAGLLALPFVKFDKWGKVLIVALTFLGMTIFVQHGGYELVKSILEGGLFGGLCWSGILLLGTVFFELKDEKVYYVLASLMLLLSVLMIVAFNYVAVKRGCTPAYAMFTTSLAAYVFAGLHALDKFNFKFSLFTWWGGSSLLVYVVNYIVCLGLGAILELTGVVMPVWAALLIMLFVMVVYSVGNWLLYRYDRHIRL